MVNFIAVVKSNISLFSKCIFFQLIVFIYIISPVRAEDQRRLLVHETSRKVEMSCGLATVSLVCGYNDNKDTLQDARVCSHTELIFESKRGKSFRPPYPKNVEAYWSPEALSCLKSTDDGQFYISVRFSSPHVETDCGAQCHIWGRYSVKGVPIFETYAIGGAGFDKGLVEVVPTLEIDNTR